MRGARAQARARVYTGPKDPRGRGQRSAQSADLSVRWGVPVAGGYLWLSGNANANRTEISGERLPAGAPDGLGFGDYFGGWAADTLERGRQCWLGQGNL